MVLTDGDGILLPMLWHRFDPVNYSHVVGSMGLWQPVQILLLRSPPLGAEVELFGLFPGAVNHTPDNNEGESGHFRQGQPPPRFSDWASRDMGGSQLSPFAASPSESGSTSSSHDSRSTDSARQSTSPRAPPDDNLGGMTPQSSGRRLGDGGAPIASARRQTLIPPPPSRTPLPASAASALPRGGLPPHPRRSPSASAAARPASASQQVAPSASQPGAPSAGASTSRHILPPPAGASTQTPAPTIAAKAASRKKRKVLTPEEVLTQLYKEVTSVLKGQADEKDCAEAISTLMEDLGPQIDATAVELTP